MAKVLQLGLVAEDNKIISQGKRHEQPRRSVAKILHLGAGVQSSTLAEMIVEGELPRVDFVLFADTGDEPDYVYKQVEYLKGRFDLIDIPLVSVRRGGMGLIESLLNGDGRFITMPMYTKQPDGSVAIVRRQCTNEFKIVPSDNYTLNWLIEEDYAFLSKGIKPRRIVKQGVLVENLYGISWDEMDRAGKRGPKWQKACYPLIDKRMSRADCIKWLNAHDLPVPKKSSCKRCPFHQDSYWLDQQVNYPVDFEESCQVDEFVRSPKGKLRFKGSMRGEFYLHSSCQPLRSIDFAGRIAAKQAMPLFDSPVCGNHCHV